MSVDVQLPVGETVVTEDPEVVVKGDLPAGRYRIRLVVETDDGKESRAFHQRLVVAPKEEP